MAIFFHGSASGDGIDVEPDGTFRALPITISGWIKPAITGVYHDIFRHGDRSTSPFVEYSIAILNTDKIDFAFNSGSGITNAIKHAASAASITANTWYHIVGMLSGSTPNHKGKLYVNGVLTTTVVGTTALQKINDNTYIGKSIWPNETASGSISDCALWTAALTDDEVRQLYDGISPLLIKPLSLKCYYPLKGISDVENDLSVNHYSSSLSGSLDYADGRPKETGWVFGTRQV